METNNNVRAMVTQRALYRNNNALGKSLEKLSTSLRINYAKSMPKMALQFCFT